MSTSNLTEASEYTDNVPDDTWSAAADEAADWGADASFVCDDAGCR